MASIADVRALPVPQPGEATAGTEVVTAEAPKKKKTPKPQPPVPRRAFTIVEFCVAHRLSRSSYYNLKIKKRTPAETELTPGGKKIITEESAAAWRAKFTQNA
jgi:hypothetical protein